MAKLNLFDTFVLQILGAFAVRDGVPMQGMKIKNVVPGKKQVSLCSCLGQSIANMSLDFSLLRHSKLRILSFLHCWLLLLLVVCEFAH